MANKDLKSTVIKLNEVRSYLRANVAFQLADKWAPRMYIQGAPGCGKSYILRDICRENGWALKTFFISNSALEMLTGLPCKVEKGQGAGWTRPEILDMSEEKLEYMPDHYEQGKTPTVLLLDDFHLCDRMMQKYCFQLFTEMGLNGYKLPNNTAIIIAGNRAQDKAGAMPIPAPVANRIAFYEVESEAEDWIKNFAMSHNVRADIITFLKNKPNFLSQDPLESTAWASPRSWTYLSGQMNAFEESFGHLDMHTLSTIAAGMIGPEYSKEFIAYRELFARWNFDDMVKMSWDRVKQEYHNACADNPTAVYAITSAGVTWLINLYKKCKYNLNHADMKKGLSFVYNTMAFLLVMKCKGINTRPLIASGVNFVQYYQDSEKNAQTKNADALLEALLDQLQQERTIDWYFYDLLAEIFKLNLDKDDQKNIAKAKAEVDAKGEKVAC